MEGRITHFSDLAAWEVNHDFVKNVYEQTKHFPAEEKFGLTSQLRRAASSITANIAGGFGRYHMKDRVRFYYQARGSNTECQNHLILSHDLGYLDDTQFSELKEQVFNGFKLLCGLIRSSQKHITQ